MGNCNAHPCYEDQPNPFLSLKTVPKTLTVKVLHSGRLSSITQIPSLLRSHCGPPRGEQFTVLQFSAVTKHF